MLRKYQNIAIDIYTKHIHEPVKTFCDHPQQVCMTYREHCAFSLTLAKLHLYGFATSTVHAFFPWMCKTSTTELNEQIRKMIKESGCKND
jgi:protoheme ferro-lyase